MSKHDKYQCKLNLDDHPLSEDEELDFVLKIDEGHLSDLEISTVSTLLSALGQIVKIKEAKFNVIKEGSTTIAIRVPSEKKHLAINNIQKKTKENQKQISRIEKELNRYKYSKAIISYGYFNDDKYEPKENLLTVNKALTNEKFSQIDSLEGRIIRLQVGKDESDHITIILNNGKEVPAICSKKILMDLHQYFNTDTRIRFTGVADYEKYPNSFKLHLKKYSINEFVVVNDMDIDEWVDSFRNIGSSGWKNFDDPISEWLKERQN